MLVNTTRFACWSLVVAIVSATATGVTLGQDGIFDDGLSGSTGPAEDPFGSDPGPSSDQAAAQEELQQRFTEASQLMQNKQYESALQILQDLTTKVRGGANDPTLALQIGICHAELGAPDSAITSLSMALVGNGAGQIPGLLDTANIYLGRMYLETNRYREALQKLSDSRQNNPTDPDANMLYGKAALRVALTTPSAGGMGGAGQAQLTSAIQALTQAIDARENFGDAHLERGRALLRTRRFDYAVEDLEAAVRSLGPDSEASADLGVAYYSRSAQESVQPNADSRKIVSDLRAAITAMDRYLDSSPMGVKLAPWDTTDPLSQTAETVMLTRAEARIKLADELANGESNDQYSEAIRDAEKVLAVDSASEENRAKAYYIRGLAIRMTGDLDGAIDALSEAIKIYQLSGDTYPDAQLRRGICLFHQGKYDLANRDFEAAASNRLNPLGLDPRAMMWAGISFAKQGDFNQAVRSYTRAIRFAPRYTKAYLNRGLAYMNMGRYERAFDDFSSILRQDPANSQASSFREMARQRM